MNEFSFHSPIYFLLLLLVPFAIYFVYSRRDKSALPFSAVGFIPKNIKTWRTLVRKVAPPLFIAGIVLAIVALARPQNMFSSSFQSGKAIAIQMVVDISGSMQALDFSTRDQERTRLDVVKEAFTEFVEKRKDDMIGLITFGGYAVTRMPLTIDHRALLLSLKSVKIPTPVFNENGEIVNQEELLTAIGDAIATACARMEKVDIKSKVIVLLSDGESNTGIIKPEEAMKMARKLGIKIYTIGIGSNTEKVPFRTRDIFGRSVIAYGSAPLDEELLRKLATETGGVYFNVRNPKGLKEALEAIDKLEKTVIKQEVYHQYDELVNWFLIPGLIMILCAASFNMLAIRRLI
jgi:Ca-activated chloride channel family protein